MRKITTVIILVQSVDGYSTGAFAQDLPPNDASEEQSALDRRINIERKTRYESFVITPHKPNYILPKPTVKPTSIIVFLII